MYSHSSLLTVMKKINQFMCKASHIWAHLTDALWQKKISKKEENWLMWHSLGRIINHIHGSIQLRQGVRSGVHLSRTVKAKMWHIKGCTRIVSRFHFRKNTSHIRIFFVVVKNVFFVYIVLLQSSDYFFYRTRVRSILFTLVTNWQTH